jgi:hypothetical protein
VIGRADTGVVPDGNPWFSSRREPGSSIGNSGEAEHGGLGRGFCTDVDLEQAAALGTGERSMPLNAVCRLLAALTKAALYWDAIGLKAYCLLSGRMIVRFDERRGLAFGLI